MGKKRYEYLPADIEILNKCKPIYVDFPGWQKPTTAAQSWKDLPLQARSYLKAVAELTGAKLKIVSVGPDRRQTIFI